MNTASHAILPGRQSRHTDGGNLASIINAPSTGGHFLFERSPVGAHQSGGHRFASFPVASACAAQTGAGRIAAKLRTPPCFPLVEVNHVAHVRLSRCETIITTGAFA